MIEEYARHTGHADILRERLTEVFRQAAQSQIIVNAHRIN